MQIMRKTSKREPDFGKDKIMSILLRLSPPVMLAQLIQALYNLIDSYFVGSYSESGLTALSIIYPLQLLMIALAVGTGVGINTLMSHFLGIGDRKKSDETAGVGIPLACAIWFAFAVICWFIMPFYADISTETKQIAQEVVVYGRIVCVCSFGIFFESVWTKILQATGNMKIPMVAQIVGAIVNIILDPIMIFGFGFIPKMGIAGAAIATVISQLVSAVLCCVYIFFKVKMLLPDRNSFKNLTLTVRDELKVGFPMGLQNSVISIGMMVLQYFVNQFGSYAVAAYTIGNRVQLLIQNPMNSMSTVIATFAGQNEGAGRYDRIKKGVNFCLLICIAYSIVIGAVSMIFAQPITGIFTSGSSQQTIDYSVQFIFWNCPFEWSLAMLFIYRGTIQGLKNGIVPMIGSLIEVVMRIMTPVIFSSVIGYASICVAGPAAWTGSMLLMIAVYYVKIRKLSKTKTVVAN